MYVTIDFLPQQDTRYIFFVGWDAVGGDILLNFIEPMWVVSVF
jgi:hypothetical protein